MAVEQPAYRSSVSLCCVGFFFQAEDGIRDYKVTGVQTCALPISLRWSSVGSVTSSLATDPTLLLVDEPSAGLAPRIAAQVYERLLEVRSAGVTILLVDQNVTKAVEISDYLYMLEIGRVRREGPRQAFADQLREIIRDSLLGA